MERQAAAIIESFISNWNSEFPNYALTATDLKKPHAVMGAVFQIFDRLGIDNEFILAPPPEEFWTDNTVYYTDLLPVINMTRVINHLVPVMPQEGAAISISHFLQPTESASHSILLVLFNLLVFNEGRLKDIAPYEEELFAKTEQVQSLEERKNKLLELLNEQSEEKGKRSLRIDKLESDIKQYEEDLKQEKEEHDKEKQELEAIVQENKQVEMSLEQKKSHRDELMDEVDKKRALRVYDADDVKHKAEQAAQNDQEAEKKLESLRGTLMQKENSLKNLHTIKRNLDTANTLLQEIMKLSDNLRDFETGDLESESKEGEIEVLITEASELQAQLSELQTARAEAAKMRLDNQLKRQQEKNIVHSALREAEEKDKKMREQTRKAIQHTEEIKEATLRYEAEKKKGMEDMALIENNFCNELKALDEMALSKMEEAAKKVEEKLRNIRKE